MIDQYVTDNLPTIKEAWPTMPAEAYVGLPGEVVRTLEPHTESDPVALLLQFLASFGSAVGRGPHYLVEGDRHFTILNAVLAGETAKSRKGTSAGRIRQIFRLADGEWEPTRVKTGLSSGEGLISEVRDPVRNGAKVIDPGVEDKRLLVLEAEFAGALTMMRRPGSVLSRVIRDAWDCRDLAVLTKNNPTRATGPHISIIGHITVDELLSKMDRTSMTNGYANRFLFACVRRVRLLPHGGDLDNSALRELAMRIQERITHARKVSRVMMTADAREVWEQAYEILSQGKPGLLGAILGQAEAQTVSLALIYALLDGSDQIGVEHLNAAQSVWSYCEASAGYIFGDVVAGKTEDVISAALEQAGETGMTRTEIRDLFGRHRKGHEIDAALATLAASKKAKRIVGATTAAVPTRCGSNCGTGRHTPFDWRSGVRHERRKRRNPSGGRLRSLMSRVSISLGWAALAARPAAPRDGLHVVCLRRNERSGE